MALGPRCLWAVGCSSPYVLLRVPGRPGGAADLQIGKNPPTAGHYLMVVFRAEHRSGTYTGPAPFLPPVLSSMGVDGSFFENGPPEGSFPSTKTYFPALGGRRVQVLAPTRTG